MASTYTPLGIELQATGENAGTWGTKTNTNLSIIEQISGGFSAQSIAGGAQTTTLSVSDGSTGAVMSHRMIEFTGTITGNQIVTIPLDAQNFYFLRNSTSGAYTVQFKYASGSGDTFTFTATNKSDAIVFATANDGTNPDIYTLPAGTGDVTLTGTQTLTNKTLTDPILSPGSATAGKIQFLEGTDNGTNKVTLIGPASTADVTVTLPAAADTLVGKATTDTLTNKTLTSPAIGTKISDTNGNELINLTATSSAVNEFTLANAATGNGPILSATGETNVDINLNPKGTGTLKSGTAAVKIAGKETKWIPAVAMYPSSTGGAPDPETVEITSDANRPVLKTIAFDKDSDEYAQFAVAFPKSWNEGTVTFQPFFTANTTNTGTALFILKGVAISDDGAISTDFGTGQGTAKAHSGTAYDLDVGAESSAITIAGSPAAGDQIFFAIFRDVSGDDLSADALLLGVKMHFTTDAANDA